MALLPSYPRVDTASKLSCAQPLCFSRSLQRVEALRALPPTKLHAPVLRFQEQYGSTPQSHVRCRTSNDTPRIQLQRFVAKYDLVVRLPKTAILKLKALKLLTKNNYPVFFCFCF
ncbi:hypothetical protein AVEN_20468-1 [Araneus ventricosus]|uniref:Uncharacterized protein n=1 Tax=Araneus ventricosus TaxID=182803 RepID=A0A4Y2WQL9_ARAVE|nr:hypothetical protein AVEN_20468-1 [Araneus ventricosus]